MWRKLLLSVAAFSAVLLLGEAAARFSGGVDRYAAYPRRLFVPTDDPRLPYRLRPGIEFQTAVARVRVNRFGLRGAEIEQRPLAGRERILLLGDSIVYGHQQDEDDTLAVRLERALAELGHPAEVLNGGAPGYNTESELAFLEGHGLSLSPSRLILAVSLNDFDDAPLLNARGYLSANAERDDVGWFATHSELYVWVRWQLSYIRGRLPWQAGEGAPEVTGRDGQVDEAARWAAFDRLIAKQHKRFYRAPAGAGWVRIQASLQGMAEISRRKELEFMVVVFPERDQLEIDPPDLSPQRRWRELAVRNDVEWLDLWPAFRADGRAGALFQDVQHPNEEGIRVAATALAERIAQ